MKQDHELYNLSDEDEAGPKPQKAYLTSPEIVTLLFDLATELLHTELLSATPSIKVVLDLLAGKYQIILPPPTKVRKNKKNQDMLPVQEIYPSDDTFSTLEKTYNNLQIVNDRDIAMAVFSPEHHLPSTEFWIGSPTIAAVPRKRSPFKDCVALIMACSNIHRIENNDIIRKIIECHPDAIKTPNSHGMLPIHSVLSAPYTNRYNSGITVKRLPYNWTGI